MLEKQTLEIIYVLKQGFNKKFGLEAFLEYWSTQNGLKPEEYTKEDVTSLLRRAYNDYIDSCDHPGGEYWNYTQALDTYRLLNRFETMQDKYKQFGEEVYALITCLHGTQIRAYVNQERINPKGDLVYINGFTAESIKQTQKDLKQYEKELKTKRT